MSRRIAVVSSLGRQKGQSPPTGSQVLGGWASLPWPVQGMFPPTPEALKAPRSPQSHPACAPARGARGIREGSGFHKQEERRGGGRCSALKIDLQAFQRGPAPEMAGGGALGCPVHPKERREGKQSPSVPEDIRCTWGAEKTQGTLTIDCCPQDGC